MKKYFIYIVVLMTSFTWISCEEDADITVPGEEAKITISSFISPSDTEITIYIAYSNPYYTGTDKNIFWIADAQVIISTENRSDTIPFDPNYQYYHLSTQEFPINAGETYTLEVKTLEGDTASATCIVPAEKTLDFTYLLDSIVTDQYKQYKVTLVFDLPDNDKYYIRAGGDISICTEIDSIMHCSGDLLRSTNKGLIEISGNNGRHEMVFYSHKFTHNGLGLMQLYLLSGDEDYYKFHKDLENIAGFFSSGLFDNPYYLHSNVNGGLGIFASYNNTIVKQYTF